MWQKVIRKFLSRIFLFPNALPYPIFSNLKFFINPIIINLFGLVQIMWNCDIKISWIVEKIYLVKLLMHLEYVKLFFTQSLTLIYNVLYTSLSHYTMAEMTSKKVSCNFEIKYSVDSIKRTVHLTFHGLFFLLKILFFWIIENSIFNRDSTKK